MLNSPASRRQPRSSKKTPKRGNLHTVKQIVVVEAGMRRNVSLLDHQPDDADHQSRRMPLRVPAIAR